MTAMMIDLKPPGPAETDDEIQIIEDLEALSEEGRCNCAASDDNPY
ncbi:hypothetical protein [Amycolatopsis sp.]|nr:hypothetical protein [Amycolatopsis sp.]HVV12094.1 hypothetical protein [Amycolatopsis sp.]